MREHYEEILSRDSLELTPLEKVVLWECAEEKDLPRLHERDVRKVMQDIDCRRTAAKGRHDLVTAAFCACLERAVQDEAPGNHSPREKELRKAAAGYRIPALAYYLRQEGVTAEAIAEKLNISYEQLRKEERNLIRHYCHIRKEKDKNVRSKADPTAANMVNTLREAPYRLFRKEAAGMTEYRIYCRDRLLGTAGCQGGRDFSVVIHCNGNTFYSSFDKTIAYGVIRDVIDADAPCETVAQLRWWVAGEEQKLDIYSAQDPQSFRVWRHPARYSSWNVYDFRDFSLKCRGEMLPLPQRQFLGEWELIYCAKLVEGFSDQTALLMMCYPLLRFAD